MPGSVMAVGNVNEAAFPPCPLSTSGLGAEVFRAGSFLVQVRCLHRE